MQLGTFGTLSVPKTPSCAGRGTRRTAPAQPDAGPGGDRAGGPLPREPPDPPGRTMAIDPEVGSRSNSASFGTARHAPRPPARDGPAANAPPTARTADGVPNPGCRCQIPAPTQILPADRAQTTTHPRARTRAGRLTRAPRSGR
jgi:hypothetical protein